MPFPTTPVLDDFNTGATQNLTARAGWGATGFYPAEPTLVTDSVPTDAGIASGSGSNYWPLLVTDCECWATLSAVLGNELDLWTRSTSINTASINGYVMTITMSTGRVRLRVVTANAFGAALVDVTPAASAINDSYGMASIGSTHTVWRKPSGASWVVLGAAQDSTWTSGVMGLEIVAGTRLDAFGGGATNTAGASFQRKGDRRA